MKIRTHVNTITKEKLITKNKDITLFAMESNRQRPVLTISVFFIIVVTHVALFWETWSILFALWLKSDFPYSYGFLTSVLFLGFSIKRLQSHASSPGILQPAISLVPLVMFISLAWFSTQTIGIQIGSEILLIISLAACFAAIYGVSVAITLLPGMFFLAMSIPIWDYTNGYLQSMTTKAATFVLGLTSIPIYIQDNFISVPAGTFEVAGGCSGLRYMLVSIVLAHFYNEIYQVKGKQRLTALIIAFIFGIAANWIRVILLILVGEFTNMQSSLVEDHDSLGWVVYGLIMVPAFILIFRLGSPAENPKMTQTSTPLVINSPSPKILFVCMGITLSALAAGPFVLSTKNLWAAEKIAPIYPNNAPHGWELKPIPQNSPINKWAPRFPGSQSLSGKVYEHNETGITVEVRVNYFMNEQEGTELVNYSNSLTNSDEWVVESISAYPDRQFQNSMLKHYLGKQYLVYSHYQVNRNTSASGLVTKLYQFQSLFLNPGPHAHIAFAVSCSHDCTKESLMLANFANQFRLK